MTAAALLLCSCSHDDATVEQSVPEPVEQGTPIAFATQQQEEQTVTRAVGLETKTTFFKVYGFKNMDCDDNGTFNDPTDDSYSTNQNVFPGYVVNWVANTAGTSTTNTNDWEYVNQQPLGQDEQTIKYWDWSAKAYRFFGVAGADGTNEVTAALKTINKGEANEYEVYELTYDADAEKEATDPTAVPYYSHLWFSNGTPGQPQFGKPVVLEFIKPLSKVRFKFIFEDPAQAKDTELTEKRFHPTNNNTIKMSGKVTITYPLTGNATEEVFSTTSEDEGMTAFKQDYYEAVSNPITVNEQTIYTYPYYNAAESPLKKVYTVLPAKNQGTYTLAVNVNGDPKTAIVPEEFMDWLPGYSYTYIFKIHVDGSVQISAVQSAFTEWTDHTATHTVYNW